MLILEMTESFDNGDLCLFSGDVTSSLDKLLRDVAVKKPSQHDNHKNVFTLNSSISYKPFFPEVQ